MGSRIYEVAESDQRGREADRGTIECGDQDLRVGIEGVGNLKISSDKVFEGFAVKAITFRKSLTESHIRTTDLVSTYAAQGMDTYAEK